jgi:hypothetical protein
VNRPPINTRPSGLTARQTERPPREPFRKLVSSDPSVQTRDVPAHPPTAVK